VSVTQFSTAKDKQGSYTVVVTSDAKETIQLSGAFSVDPMAVNGEVSVKAIPLKRYAPYYQDSVGFDLEDGRLDLSAHYAAAQKDGSLATKITQLGASLRALRLRDRAQTANAVEIPAASITDTELDTGERRIRVGGVSTRGGKLSVVRDKGGEVLILRLFRPTQPATPAAPVAAEPAGAPWRVELGRFLLEQYTVVMADQRPSVPITVLAEQIRLSAENLTTAGKTPGKVALALLLDKTTNLSVAGNLLIEPMRMDGTIDIKSLPLKTYAPYYQDSILFDILAGQLELATRFNYAASADQPDVRLSGLAATVSSLQLRKRGEGEDFLVIPQTAIKDTSLDLSKRQLNLGDVSTQDGSLLVKRYRSGELNLLTLVPASGGAAQAGPAMGSGPSGAASAAPAPGSGAPAATPAQPSPP
jgi:hypothetical protein